MTTLIKACVRLNKQNQLELFWYDEHKTLNCFTNEESHNEASYQYMLSCKVVSECEAKRFIDSYNKFYEHVDDDCNLVYSKKLSSSKWCK